MRSVLMDEMDLIWKNYEAKIQELGFKNMMLMPQKELMEHFRLNYKNLYYQVKYRDEDLGKTRKETSYSQLKLRRLIALWVKSNVWIIEGGVSYSLKDKRNEFPLFNSQRPGIIPMPKTIKKLQAKCLHQFIEDYNSNYAYNKFMLRGKTKYISNLKDLRNVLMTKENFTEAQANNIIKLYGSVVAKKEVYDFSNEEINLNEGEIR